MVEVIGGVLWVYLPIFGIHEVPGILTMIGGVIVLFAIMLDGIDTERVRQMIKQLTGRVNPSCLVRPAHNACEQIGDSTSILITPMFPIITVLKRQRE